MIVIPQCLVGHDENMSNTFLIIRSESLKCVPANENQVPKCSPMLIASIEG